MGEIELGAAMKSGLITWRNLVDSDGEVHAAKGPWLAACGGEGKGRLTPTDDPTTCRHWACRAH